MDISTLTVHFRGICTHFSRIVPGIPHRVVFPDATALRFGGIDLPTHAAKHTELYALLPHIAVVRAPDVAVQNQLTVRGVMEKGVIIDGVRLHVANAIGNHVEYCPEYTEITQLADFVEAYQFADEVVLGGRASCYFDVVTGNVMRDVAVNGQIAGVSITMQTSGPPVLSVSPFFQSTPSLEIPDRRPAVSFIQLPAGDVKLLVANAGVGCQGGADGFDFLLNYLTQKGGIPRSLTVLPPQITLPATPVSMTLESAASWLSLVPTPWLLPLPQFPDLVNSTLSCSNTQFP